MERLRLVFDGSLSVDSYDPDRKRVDLKAENLYFYEHLADESMGFDLKKIEVEYQEKGADLTESAILKKDSENGASYSGTIDLSKWKKPEGEFRLNLYTADGKVYKNVDTLDYLYSGG